jgi:hypothetical protein
MYLCAVEKMAYCEATISSICAMTISSICAMVSTHRGGTSSCFLLSSWAKCQNATCFLERLARPVPDFALCSFRPFFVDTALCEGGLCGFQMTSLFPCGPGRLDFNLTLANRPQQPQHVTHLGRKRRKPTVTTDRFSLFINLARQAAKYGLHTHTHTHTHMHYM